MAELPAAAKIDPKEDSIPPALRRDLQVIPVEHEGKPLFVLRDSEGLTEKTLALSPGGMLIASLLNGRHTYAELQTLITKATGTLLGHAEIRKMVQELERMELLETPQVQEKLRKAMKDFLDSPVRKAASSAGYPQDKLELAGFLGAFFRDPKGPGKPLADKPSRGQAPLGLVCPHIDLQRGGPAYAWAYGALAECPPPDLVVALGVAHAAPNSPWTMTKKAYETPYGPMPVHQGLYQDIKSSLWYDPCDDEWVHRKEHSLEFQALWLKYLWRDNAPPWVPILCSAFDRFCTDRAPSSVATVENALQEIGRKLAQRSKTQRILVLAGVDLAHVGPAFGDDLEPGPELEKRVEAEDRKSLEHAMALDADKFYLSVTADKHWRKVCGLSALYTALRWIKVLNGDKPCPGKLLTYGQSPDPSGGIVSFAGAVFEL